MSDYDSLISRANAQPLIPEEYFPEIMQAVTEQSALMRLAKRLPNISRKQERLMITSALATGSFQDTETALIKTTSVEWKNRYIDAEVLSVIIPIPKAVIADTAFDIWASCRPQMVEALGIAVDKAGISGIGIPTSWATNMGTSTTPYNGLIARCAAAGTSHVISKANYRDWYEALFGETDAGVLGAQSLLESQGFMATGWIAHPTVKGKLRNTRDSVGQPIFRPEGAPVSTSFAFGQLDGAQMIFPLNGAINPAESLIIGGQWDKLVYAIREDMQFEISTQGVISDGSGAIVANLFQQNMVALKATLRLGFALPNPINRMVATEVDRCPFVVVAP